MVGPEFASCFLKLGRAEEHIKALEVEVKAWAKGKPYVITHQSDSQGKRHSAIVDVISAPPLERWSLIAGDCIHNLRAALDHVIYGLAIRDTGRNPPPDWKKFQFPIVSRPDDYPGQKYRIALLNPGAQTIIEGSQPYNRPHPFLPPLLCLLSDFDNADKHRLLNVVITNVVGGKFSLTMPDDGSIIIPKQIDFRRDPIESGAEVVWFILEPPNRNVRYEHETAVVVSIGHTAGPSGSSFSELGYVLDNLIAEVKNIIDRLIL